MSQKVNWTEAEKRSFAIVPETCDVIDRAISQVGQFDRRLFNEVVGKYVIGTTDNLFYAFAELHSRLNNVGLANVRDIVHYKGTFPLRLALVSRIEEDMRAAGEAVQQNHYAYWISSGLGMLEYRAEKSAGTIPVEPDKPRHVVPLDDGN